MEEQTTILAKSGVATDTDATPGTSHFMNVSIRAWLALLLTASVCLISLMAAYAAIKVGQPIKIEEPLYSLSIAAVSFYLGQIVTTPKTVKPTL